MSSVIVVKYGFRRAVIAAGLRGAPGTGGGGGSAGVSSFNTRTGAVTLTGADVTGALAYTPANNASLAGVAFSGAYADLSGRPSLAAVALSGAYADLSGAPFIPAAPGDIGAATSAQGALADTAVQPAALTVQLDLKVDKIAGYGLSQENFTPAEKAKLAGLDGPLWKGTYTSLAALQSAHPTAEPGSSAHVDAGVGDPVKVYNWDASDGEWVAGGGDAAPITAAQVKTLYDSNPDTNAYTDAEKSKLNGVAAGATANADTDTLAEGGTNKWFTTARVLATVLSGLSLATGTAVVDTDSVLAGFGKLQRQINDLVTAVNGKQATLVSGTNIKTINGASLLGSGDLTVGGGSSDLLSALTASEVSISGATTLTGTAFGKMHACSGTSANYTVVLPAASGNAGKIIGFRMEPGLTKLVTIDANASELIDGQQTRVMWKHESAVLLCDGTGWTKIAGKSLPMVCEMYPTSSVTAASAVATKIPLEFVVRDDSGAIADPTTNKRMNIPRTGLWRAQGIVYYQPGPQPMERNSCRIYRNGNIADLGINLQLLPVPASLAYLNQHDVVLSLAGGDYLELYAYQLGGSRDIFVGNALLSYLSLVEQTTW